MVNTILSVVSSTDRYAAKAPVNSAAIAARSIGSTTGSTAGSTTGSATFQAVLSQQQPVGSVQLPVGSPQQQPVGCLQQPVGLMSLHPAVEAYAGQGLVNTAIVAQAAAQALAGGGANPLIAGPDGYGRGAALDYVAQLQNVIANNSYLPNASGPGLTILPGTPRNEAPQSTIDDYTRVVEQLTARWGFTPAETSSAGQRLSANLAAGISLDPGTSAALALEAMAPGVSAAQFAVSASSQSASPGTGVGGAPLATAAGLTKAAGPMIPVRIARPATATKASKIVALKASIAHWTQLVAAQKAKGNGRTAARDQKVLDRYRKQLAALTS
jgi:hypothetical protein